MYPTVREQLPEAEAAGVPARGPVQVAGRVGRTVVLLGLTSLFTDISSEMVSAVLPVYLTLLLGLSPLQFGIVDGLYQGVTALVRLLGGWLADRWHRYKEVATAGYAISALAKLGLLAAGGAYGLITAVIAVDRTGKGVRTAPRDALISFSAPAGELGRAFGVHRALDTAGALAGPLVAFALLAAIPGAYDTVFVGSFAFAVIGLGILILFVRNPAGHTRPSAGARPSLAAAARVLGRPGMRTLVAAGVLLSLVTVSDGFVYLTLQRRASINAGWFPLLFVGTALIYLVLAVPLGKLADRIGRAKVFVAGHLALFGLYAVLLAPSVGLAGVAASLALLGVYYAATDGVLSALASTLVPAKLRTSGLALVTTATAVTRLVGSVLFGAFWTWWGPELAVVAFAAGLLVAVPVAAVLLARRSAEATG